MTDTLQTLVTEHMPLRQAMRLIAVEKLSRARSYEPGIMQCSSDTELVHQYRVNLRKLRAMLSLLKQAYPAHELQDLKQRLGQIAKQTNHLRDLDVYLLDKDSYLDLVPGSLGDGLPLMFDDFARQQQGEQQRVARWLSSERYQDEAAALQAFFTEPDNSPQTRISHAPLKPVITKQILRRYHKVCRQGLEITPQTPDAQVHQLRIECKKLRYLLELFGELYQPKRIKQLIKRLKQLQDNLGRFNDYVVQQQTLEHYLQQHAPDNRLARSVGALLMVLAQKQQQERSQIERRFDEFADEATSQLIQKLFMSATG